MTDDIAKIIGGVVILMGVILGGLLLAASIGLLMAFPVMWCWNYVMPYLFGFPAITWGKAWCLMFLANCLLKSKPLNLTKKEE